MNDFVQKLPLRETPIQERMKIEATAEIISLTDFLDYDPICTVALLRGTSLTK